MTRRPPKSLSVSTSAPSTRKRPGASTFAATTEVLEDTGVSAYLGQVSNIFQRGVLAAAGTIATVEARHAAWIRFINGDTPAPSGYDVRKSEAAILKAVTGTGFIK